MINAVDARTLARSVMEARREGRKLKPLTNTRLLNTEDALKIQDALIELRVANGEELLGWAIIDGSHLAPLMTNNVVDDRVVMGIPSVAVDVRVEPVIILGTSTWLGLQAIDRLITAPLVEDVVASGHGLAMLARGDEITTTETFEIRTARTRQSVSGTFDHFREEAMRLLKIRGRDLSDSELVVSPALLPGEPLVRGKEALLQAFIGDREMRCSLRHL